MFHVREITCSFFYKVWGQYCQYSYVYMCCLTLRGLFRAGKSPELSAVFFSPLFPINHQTLSISGSECSSAHSSNSITICPHLPPPHQFFQMLQHRSVGSLVRHKPFPVHIPHTIHVGTLTELLICIKPKNYT